MNTSSRRSDPTRAAILAAGRRRFASLGFSATTVRAVAEDAGSDPSLVIRYFGSKQGLYDAATAAPELALPDFSHVRRSRVGAVVVGEFLDRWEGPAGEPLRALLASAAVDPTSAVRMRETFSGQGRPAVGAAARDHQDARTVLVATTMIGLAMSRYMLRLPGLVELDRNELIALYVPVVQRCLTGPLPGSVR